LHGKLIGLCAELDPTEFPEAVAITKNRTQTLINLAKIRKKLRRQRKKSSKRLLADAEGMIRAIGAATIRGPASRKGAPVPHGAEEAVRPMHKRTEGPVSDQIQLFRFASGFMEAHFEAYRRKGGALTAEGFKDAAFANPYHLPDRTYKKVMDLLLQSDPDHDKMYYYGKDGSEIYWGAIRLSTSLNKNDPRREDSQWLRTEAVSIISTKPPMSEPMEAHYEQYRRINIGSARIGDPDNLTEYEFHHVMTIPPSDLMGHLEDVNKMFEKVRWPIERDQAIMAARLLIGLPQWRLKDINNPEVLFRFSSKLYVSDPEGASRFAEAYRKLTPELKNCYNKYMEKGGVKLGPSSFEKLMNVREADVSYFMREAKDVMGADEDDLVYQMAARLIALDKNINLGFRYDVAKTAIGPTEFRTEVRALVYSGVGSLMKAVKPKLDASLVASYDIYQTQGELSFSEFEQVLSAKPGNTHMILASLLLRSAALASPDSLELFNIASKIIAGLPPERLSRFFPATQDQELSVMVRLLAESTPRELLFMPEWIPKEMLDKLTPQGIILRIEATAILDAQNKIANRKLH